MVEASTQILDKLFGKGQTLRLVYPCANGQNKLECLALVIFGASLTFASKARAFSKIFSLPKKLVRDKQSSFSFTCYEEK
jgi:hypothetical protein